MSTHIYTMVGAPFCNLKIRFQGIEEKSDTLCFCSGDFLILKKGSKIIFLVSRFHMFGTFSIKISISDQVIPVQYNSNNVLLIKICMQSRDYNFTYFDKASICLSLSPASGIY